MNSIENSGNVSLSPNTPNSVQRTGRAKWLLYAGLIVAFIILVRLLSPQLPQADIGFVLTIMVVALSSWCVRSFVALDPDPFFLSFTFFAFAGQVIRTLEFVFGDGAVPSRRQLAVTGGLAFTVILLQVMILRAHARVTLEHYKRVLATHKKSGCTNGEIDNWARVLLRISGVDFSPGLYSWMSLLGGSDEPRERRREEAFSILPDKLFRLSAPNALTAESLAVPATITRRTLWAAYVGACAAAWILFVLTLSLTRT